MAASTASTAEVPSADSEALGAAKSKQRPHVLVAVSGSVATIKAVPLVTALCEFAEVRLVTTTSAKHFLDRAGVAALIGDKNVFEDSDEWAQWSKMGDDVLHIELRRWADLLVIAPLSANTLAKLANGLSDNLLTSVCRAWDRQRPLLVAPAMNTLMWDHPFTARHLATLESLGIVVLPTVAKRLACGDVGLGAMAEVPFIVAAVRQSLEAAGAAVAAATAPESA